MNIKTNLKWMQENCNWQLENQRVSNIWENGRTGFVEKWNPLSVLTALKNIMTQDWSVIQGSWAFRCCTEGTGRNITFFLNERHLQFTSCFAELY